MTDQANAATTEETEAKAMKEVDPKEIMDFLKSRLSARFKMWLNICAHCGMCQNTFHSEHRY